MPVLVGRKIGEYPPCHPKLRRATLAITIETMQAIQLIHQPVQKIHACCMVLGNLRESAESLRNTPRSYMCSIHTMISKPVPAPITSTTRPSNSTVWLKRLTPLNIMMNPSQKRRREKIRRKSLRVIRPIQTHHRMNVFMALTAWSWANLHMTREMAPNDSSHNVGKEIW